MSLEMTAQVVGLLGDVTTFIGAILLALREAGEGKAVLERMGISNILGDLKLRKLTIQIDDMVINDEGQAEIAIARRRSKRARTGAWLIVGGFVLLTIARALEIIRSSH